MYDIIVVGGGPAGMTAALYALRNGKSVLVIEKSGFGGQITFSPKVENIPGFASISGNEFADKFLDQILSQGAEVELGNVISVTSDGNIKIVSTDDGNTFQSKAVILALGVKHRMLGLPGEEDLVGNGISFCAVCDGDFYSNRTVCVAGGGNSALQEAILLSNKCKRVIMLQDLDHFTGEKKLQDTLFAHDNVDTYVNVKILGIETSDDGIKDILIQNNGSGETTAIECDGLFVAIGLIPENSGFENIANLNSYGYFDSSESCTTKTAGIFVAGDCRSKSIRQVATAASDGAVAALAACTYIENI